MVVCSVLEHSAMPKLWQGTNMFLLTGDHHKRHAVCPMKVEVLGRKSIFFIKENTGNRNYRQLATRIKWIHTCMAVNRQTTYVAHECDVPHKQVI